MKSVANDSILITCHDLKRLFIRLLPQLRIVAILLFCLSCCYFVLKRPQYLAKASFKHLDKQSDYSSFAKDFLKELTMPSQSAAIYSVMHSNRVLKNTVEQLGMQIIADYSLFEPIGMMNRVLKNLKSECGRKPKDPDPFYFRNVSFEGEKPFRFYVKSLNSKTFEILDSCKKVIGRGELGKALVLPECSFTLICFPQSIESAKHYGFAIIPWQSAADLVRKAFEIRSHKLDKNVFTLYFKHDDRHLASQFLNQVMQSYQEYYRKENEEICETQVAYLEKRQDELIRQFDSALKEHVAYLKNNVTESGCIGFSNELDILATPQNLFNSKLFDIDIELKRLESVYANPFLNEKELTLEERKLPQEDKQLALRRQNLNECLINHELDQKRLSLSQPSQDSEILDCDALSLQSAKTLYLQYTEKKDVSEAQLRERIFLRDRLNDPDFELSSLSTFLPDPVTVSLAQHASDIALKIKDPENRTAREQERLKEQLDTQKRFLHQHLTHMIELEKLQLKLLSHKIDSLQHQTRSLLDTEKHLIQEKITELNQKMSTLPEKWHRENLLLLKKELGSRIIGSMTQLVETKNLNQKLYQVSSKHLDLSVPPLRPLPPHLLTYSLAIAFLGCFTFYTYRLCKLFINGFPVSHANLKYSGLTSFGMLSSRSADPLDQLGDADVATLRGIAHFISSTGQCVALLSGKNPDYSASLAELLSFSGKKVLLIHCLFNKEETEEDPGLFSYLQGKEIEIPICRRGSYDEILSGKTPRYAADMFAHPSFSKMLTTLKQQYDIILLLSNASINGREAHPFMQVADALVIAVRDESQEDLSPYREWAEKKQNPCLAFVCFD